MQEEEGLTLTLQKTAEVREHAGGSDSLQEFLSELCVHKATKLKPSCNEYARILEMPETWGVCRGQPQAPCGASFWERPRVAGSKDAQARGSPDEATKNLTC